MNTQYIYENETIDTIDGYIKINKVESATKAVCNVYAFDFDNVDENGNANYKHIDTLLLTASDVKRYIREASGQCYNIVFRNSPAVNLSFYTENELKAMQTALDKACINYDLADAIEWGIITINKGFNDNKYYAWALDDEKESIICVDTLEEVPTEEAHKNLINL